MLGSLMMLAVGRLGKLTELGEIVGLPPFSRQAFRKVGEDAAGQGDVARLDDDACGAA